MPSFDNIRNFIILPKILTVRQGCDRKLHSHCSDGFGMVLSDSWYQETYILSICNALIAYHKIFLDSCEIPTVRKWAWSL